MFKVQWGQADSNHHESPSRPSACVCVCVGRGVSQASLYTHWAWLVRSWLRMNSVRSWVILFFISSKYWPIFWRSVASCAKLPVGGFQNTKKTKSIKWECFSTSKRLEETRREGGTVPCARASTATATMRESFMAAEWSRPIKAKQNWVILMLKHCGFLSSSFRWVHLATTEQCFNILWSF